MPSVSYVCWSCGHVGEAEGIFRTTECASCEAWVRACKNCKHFDPYASNDCREPVADFVRNKEAANFCAYFQPLQDRNAQAEKVDDARAKLEALFKNLE